MTSNNAPGRARWAVMWVYVNKRGKREVARKDFGDDEASARELYLKARDAGKPAVTLACVNMGFPPPMSLRPRVERKKFRKKGSRKIIVKDITIEPLREINAGGKLWCPYCRELRPFVFRKVRKLHGVSVHDPHYKCPICGVTQRDHNVRVWNPHAALHMDASISSMARTRSSTKSPTTRRRRR